MAKAYFSHDSDARLNNKMLKLRATHGPAGYGVYWMLVERLRSEEGYCAEKNYKILSFDLHADEELVRSVVEDFDLFDISEDGKTFTSHGLEERMEIMEVRSEAGKKGAAARWGSTSKSKGKSRHQLLSEARDKGTHTKEDWYKMLRFFGGCVICGRSGSDVRLVKDHIIPLYQGGGDLISNIQPLCQSCNLKKGADNHDYRIDWCEEHGAEMPDEWLAKDAEMPGKKCETPANKKKLNKTLAYKKGKSGFPSLDSSPEGSESEGEEKEKILFEFFFEKNLASPEKEVDLFLDYNNRDGRIWAQMSEERKDEAIKRWRQEPPQSPRFRKDFLSMWRNVYEVLRETGAPTEVRLDALSDTIAIATKGIYVRLTCSLRLKNYLESEEVLIKVRPHILGYVKLQKAQYLQYLIE